LAMVCVGQVFEHITEWLEEALEEYDHYLQ
jgi:hypothetical protein